MPIASGWQVLVLPKGRKETIVRHECAEAEVFRLLVGLFGLHFVPILSFFFFFCSIKQLWAGGTGVQTFDVCYDASQDIGRRIGISRYTHIHKYKELASCRRSILIVRCLAYVNTIEVVYSIIDRLEIGTNARSCLPNAALLFLLAFIFVLNFFFFFLFLFLFIRNTAGPHNATTVQIAGDIVDNDNNSNNKNKSNNCIESCLES